MIAWIRRLFVRRDAGEPDPFYTRLHDASVNALAQTRESRRETRRIKQEHPMATELLARVHQTEGQQQ